MGSLYIVVVVVKVPGRGRKKSPSLAARITMHRALLPHEATTSDGAHDSTVRHSGRTISIK